MTYPSGGRRATRADGRGCRALAQVSDIATAIFDGADAVMLSAESAAGKYPVEAVAMQQRIISTVEGDASYRAQASGFLRGPLSPRG